MSQNNRQGQGQNNGRRGTASHSTNYRGGRRGGRGGGYAGSSGRLSNNGNELVGEPISDSTRESQVKYLRGMKIDCPNFKGVIAWNQFTNTASKASFKDKGAQTTEDPLVIWTCPFGMRGTNNPALLADINQVAKNEAREMGFRCAMIRKEPHATQYERTAEGQPTMTFNDATQTTQRTIIPADLHITVYMGNGLSRCHVHGHIYLDKVDQTDTSRVPTRVTKMKDPASRKLVPPGEEAVTSEYWLMTGVEAWDLDNKLIRGE